MLPAAKKKSYKTLGVRLPTGPQGKWAHPPLHLLLSQASSLSHKQAAETYTLHSTVFHYVQFEENFSLRSEPKRSFAIQVNCVLVLLLSPQTQHKFIPTSTPESKFGLEQKYHINNRPLPTIKIATVITVTPGDS